MRGLIYDLVFGNKNNTDKLPISDNVQQKLQRFNKAWDDLISFDQKIGLIGGISFFIAKEISTSLSLLILAIGGIYAYPNRIKKYKLFEACRNDLYQEYLKRINPNFILNKETLTILEAIAPLINDTESLIPPKIHSIFTGPKSIHNDGELKILFQRWCDIMARAPHYRQFNFVTPEAMISYGLFKEEKLTDKVKQEGINLLYGAHKEVSDPARENKLLIRKFV